MVRERRLSGHQGHDKDGQYRKHQPQHGHLNLTQAADTPRISVASQPASFALKDAVWSEYVSVIFLKPSDKCQRATVSHDHVVAQMSAPAGFSPIRRPHFVRSVAVDLAYAQSLVRVLTT